MADLLTPLTFAVSINDFFNKMFDDILAGRVTLESVLLIVAFFGTFVMLTALSFVFAKKPHEVMLDQPITWITDYNRITELLNSAVTQRSKVRVSFLRDQGAARSSDGTLIDANKTGLTLEMSSLTNISPDWVGRTLEMYFRMRTPDQPKLQTTLSFISDILSYQMVEDEILQLRISRPLRLEINQNRLHLRVEPPEKYVRTFKLWTEEQVSRHGDSRDPDSWPEPAYSSSEGDREPEIVLENISGGGVRVEIKPGALRAKRSKITVNQEYYAQLTLADPDLAGFSTHYVLMRVLKCYDDCDSLSQLSLGMTFSAVGVPVEPPLTGLRWRTVNRDNGIAELDDWAYELHLELYRNRGVA
jgi:hypothetical protein